MVAKTEGDRLVLTLKRLYTEVGDGYMWNLNKNKGPREEVRIAQQSIDKGPEVTGTLIIQNDGESKKVIEKTGYFAEYN